MARAHDGVVVFGVGAGDGSGFDVEDEVGGAGEGGIAGAGAEHVDDGFPPVDGFAFDGFAGGYDGGAAEDVGAALADGEGRAKDAGEDLPGARDLVPGFDYVEGVEDADAVSGVDGVDFYVLEEVFFKYEGFDG